MNLNVEIETDLEGPPLTGELSLPATLNSAPYIEDASRVKPDRSLQVVARQGPPTS